MNRKNILAWILLAALLAMLAACTSERAAEQTAAVTPPETTAGTTAAADAPATETSAAETTAAPETTASETAAAAADGRRDAIPGTEDREKGVTLFTRGGLTMALPTEYVPQLLISDYPEWNLENGESLFSVYEKASMEDAAKAYGPDAGGGFLFNITRNSRAQYERYLSSPEGDRQFFARSGGDYYCCAQPTDVQFFRIDEKENAFDSDEMKKWNALTELRSGVLEDFVSRNGLEAYDDSQVWNKKYTWDGAHKFVRYDNPAFGYGENCWLLTLSQPVRAGDGGIWCVDHYTDEYGQRWLWFPNANRTDDVTAEELLRQEQADADAGTGSADLTDPIAAAKAFIGQSPYASYTGSAEEGTYEEVREE